MSDTIYTLTNEVGTFVGTAENIAKRLVGNDAHPALLADTIREVEYHGKPAAEAKAALGFLDEVWADDPEWQRARTATHRVEQWSVNFRGQKVYADEFYGSLAECREAVAKAEGGTPYTTPATPGHHLAIRRLSDNRIVEHTGPKGFRHTIKSAIYA